MSDEKPKPQPGPPSYCSMSGMPWVASQMWFDALTGGKLNMGMISEPAHAAPLKIERKTRLLHERMAQYGRPFNPGLVVVNGELLANVRVCDHKQQVMVTQNFHGRVSSEGAMEGTFLKDATDAGPFKYGFEDMRLFNWKGGLWALAAVSMQGTAGNPRTVQCLARVDGDTLRDATVLDSDRHEKNWMPCVTGNELRFVYATDPLVVLSFLNGAPSPAVKNLPEINSVIRGGAPLQPYKDGWVSVVHQIHAKAGNLGKAVYVHRFAFFDQDLRAAKLSEPFYYEPGIEFCSGLVQHDGLWRIGMGVRDEEAWILDVTPETLSAYESGSIDTPKHMVKGVGGSGLRANPNGGSGGAPAARAPQPAMPSGIVGQPSPGAVPPAWNPMLGGFPPNGGGQK